MKMFYGNIPVNSMKVKHYEVSTNDATLKASDMQAGVTAYAKGKKVTGTGKCFEFANYGHLDTNLSRYIPNGINIIEIGSIEYPIQLSIPLNEMCNVDFSADKIVASVIIDGVGYDLSVSVKSNILTITCEKTISLEVFFGKDNYIS